ncbi:MAG: tetratricopeptide repeat protein [Cytophagales bacterium]|nr:tetratricopeptide repeat protein [Cytophagales bacterium]
MNKSKPVFPVVFLGVTFIILPLVYFQSALDPVLTPRFFILAVLLTLSLLLLIYKKVNDQLVTHTPILQQKIFYAFLMFTAVSGFSLLKAINISEGIYELFKLFTLFIFFVIITLLIENGKDIITQIFKAINISTLIISAIGLYQFYLLFSTTKLFNVFESQHSITSTLAHKNLFALTLFLTIPFIIYGIFRFNKIWKRLCIINLVLVLIELLLLQTRSVWFAFFVSFLLSFMLSAIRLRKSIQVISENFKTIKSITFLVVIAIITVTFLIISKTNFWESYKIKIISTLHYNETRNEYSETIKERLLLWNKSLQMVRENPVLGVGSGNWKIIIPSYGTGNLRSSIGLTHYQRPHNDFLWVLAENGVAGLVCYILVYVLLIYYIIKIILGEEESFVAFLMFFGITGFMIISFFSFPKERIFPMILFLTMSAIVTVKYNALFPKRKQLASKYNRFLMLLTIAITSFSTYIAATRIYGEYHTKKALEARSVNNWSLMIKEIDKAQSNFYTLDPMSTPILWYKGIAHFNLNNITEALNNFNLASFVHPYHIHVLNNIATCHELSGNHKQAIKYYQIALSISPVFEESILNLAAVYFNQGKVDDAYKVLRQWDTSRDNPKYITFLTTILSAKINKLLERIQHHEVKKIIIKISKTKEWLSDIEIKANKNKVSIEDQLIKDAVYSLEVIDKKITAEEASVLRKKYVSK